jgi:hypothetical protein
MVIKCVSILKNLFSMQTNYCSLIIVMTWYWYIKYENVEIGEKTKTGLTAKRNPG